MIEELFIEGYKVDSSNIFSQRLNYLIDDIKDFSKRGTTFSQTIILPGTKKNNALFGNIFQASTNNEYVNTLPNISINFNPALNARAILFVGNLQVFKGTIRMLEVIVNNGVVEYEMALVGELGGLISKLGNKKIEDLDFSAYNHTYSIANITASWDNWNDGQGYVYPLIDYGTFSTLKHNWDYKTLRPALFLKEYIDKIFAMAQYTYICDFFNTETFKTIIIPNNQKRLTSSNNAALNLTGVSPIAQSGLTAQDYVIPYDVITLGSFTTSDNKTFTYSSATSVTGNLRVVLKATGVVLDPVIGNWSLYFQIIKNGVVDGYIFAVTGSFQSIDFDQTFTNVTFNNGDTILFNIEVFRNNPSFSWNLNISERSVKLSTSTNQLVEVNLGEPVIINDTIPKNHLQTNFLSSIIRMFNLYLFEDSKNNNIVIKPFIDYFTSADTEDWSYKLDRSKPIRLKPMSELNARYYSFAYKSDSDFYNNEFQKRYNKNYGEYIYDTNFEFVNNTERVEVIFSGTPLLSYEGEDKFFSSIFKRNNTTEENIDSNIRLLFCRKIEGVSSWDIKNIDTVLTSVTSYLYAGHLNIPNAPTMDLNFGVLDEYYCKIDDTDGLTNNLFNNYWSYYMAEITNKDSKLLTAMFKIDYKDIYKLDFSKLKYIDGVLYRLNKIIEWNASKEELTKVELLKVIEKI